MTSPSFFNAPPRFFKSIYLALVVVAVYASFFTSLPSKLPQLPKPHASIPSKVEPTSTVHDAISSDFRFSTHVSGSVSGNPSTKRIKAQSTQSLLRSHTKAVVQTIPQATKVHPTNMVTQPSQKAGTKPHTKPTETNSPMEAVANATLGFEKIIAINLPERTDRRDVLSLMSTMNNIKLEWHEAVKGEDLATKAWPSHWDKKLKMGELGNWRSHLSAIRRVVEEGYSSALIIEDDADWDLSLKSQLHMFAEKARIIGNVPLDKQTPSPYGDAWDLLWLGECATPPGPSDSQIFPGAGDQAHWVFRTHGGMACLYGYAVTQRSARMLMGWLLDVDEATDFAVGKFCSNHSCVTVWPELIGSHKSAGPRNRDSSISNQTDEAREKGETRNIVNSAILDMLGRIGPSPKLRVWPG
ncbi:MAG: hypothetical protein HETSPECPRED_009616 [Heterodermia speciosa]|uniref:Glycosyl transferase family 25 domain-containing protein n=1 Tax=Heterodermia speciosa TaxID=116794 RepID=A0A8H3I0F5_9LECA|nr:MAG: hypothetical protein HETSPECPRED_009616 [Heterodermia speciosa]